MQGDTPCHSLQACELGRQNPVMDRGQAQALGERRKPRSQKRSRKEAFTPRSPMVRAAGCCLHQLPSLLRSSTPVPPWANDFPCGQGSFISVHQHLYSKALGSGKRVGNSVTNHGLANA